MLTLNRTPVSSRTPIDEIDPERVGGKAWNLFRLAGLGFSVPPWIVIPADLFEELVEPHRAWIASILDSIDFHDCDRIELASRRIRERIAALELGGAHRRELRRAIAAEFPEFPGGALLAVRSSVVGEDSAKNSFAGQMDSLLNVRPAAVEEAIARVWASAYSARALLYRRGRGIDTERISQAVIVQEMVQAKSSGVLFTREPGSGARRCVIAAGPGLGEGVVADIVETDTYRVDWRSREVVREVREKDCRVVLDAGKGSGTRVEPLPAGDRSGPVLGDGEILALRDIGVEAEQRLGLPLDIEWAQDRQGGFHLLQARAITGSRGGANRGNLRVWDNSNIVESYPGLTLPLTFSLVRESYERIFRNSTRCFLLFRGEFSKKLHMFKNLIGLLDGRVYYCLLNWYEMFSYLPGFRRNREAFDRMIGVSGETDVRRNRLSLLNAIFSLATAVRILLSVRRTATRFFADFNRELAKLGRIDVCRATEDELVAVHDSVGREFTERWHLTLHNDFCAMKYYDWLRRLCRRWIPSSRPNLHDELLAAQEGIESVEPVRSLVRIASMVRADPAARRLVERSDERTICRRIREDGALTEIREAISEHLRRYGDRGIEELKLEQPSLAERPEFLVGLIANYCRLGLTVEAMERRELSIRRRAEVLVRRYLRNPLKRLIFRLVLASARRAVANRGNMRFARTRLFGFARRLFRRMGELFAGRGLIEKEADIFYLTVEEILGTVRGTAVTRDLAALVDIRKREYARFARSAPGDRMVTRGIPCLDLSAREPPADESGNVLTGIGCGSGVAEGPARIVDDPCATGASSGHILVTRSTDPGWVFLMISSRGIVVERGSVLSHAAIVGRELGIPTVVGARDATRRIPDGATVTIDGSTGEVRWR